MPACAIGQPCSDGCFEKLGQERVQDIFANFWGLGDINRQNAYILGCIRIEKFKRKYTKKEHSQRSVKFAFEVTHSNNIFSVCRTGFANIHGLGTKKNQIND